MDWIKGACLVLVFACITTTWAESERGFSIRGEKKIKDTIEHDAAPTKETWQKPVSKTKAQRFGKAAAAADHFVCSRIGSKILKKGGHAVDAIIAVHHCTEVLQLHSTGLGAGGFLLVHDKEKGDTAFNFRETIPTQYDNSTIEKSIGDTILVPGVVKGLIAAHKKYGKLKWADLFEPAIKLCDDGFRVHTMLAMGIDKKLPDVISHLGMKQELAPSGQALTKGMLMKRRKLARTYRQLQKDPESFYKGSIAEQVIKDIREVGGQIQKEDLEAYKVKETKPLELEISGMRMLFVPPPSGGLLIAFMMKILDEYNKMNSILKLKDKPAEYYHVIIEAFKLAYGPYSFLGDPDYTPKNDEYVKYMLDPENAKKRAKMIKPMSQPLHHYKPYNEVPKKQEAVGTSHMTVVGEKEDAATLTSSINAYFGSKIRSRELGFYYNNEITDFAEFWPSVYGLSSEQKLPGRAPMSRSSPIIFLDKKTGALKGAFGAAGGHFIPTAMTTTLANWIYFKDDLKLAINRPRLHCQLFPPSVVVEPSFPHDLFPELTNTFKHADMTNNTYDVTGAAHAILGVVQAVVKDGDQWAAESDYRKGGLSDGY